MKDLKQFRKANHLKQADLAEFLEVSRAFIAMVETGKTKMPSEKVSKILNNPYGWDTSEFTETSISNSVVIGGDVSGNNQIDNRHYYSDSPDVLRAQIEVLDARIKEKDAQIKEKDAQIKEKDAQIKEKDAQINKLLDILSQRH